MDQSTVKLLFSEKIASIRKIADEMDEETAEASYRQLIQVASGLARKFRFGNDFVTSGQKGVVDSAHIGTPS